MPHAHTWSSGEGRKKLSSKPTLTSMMTTSKSANKRDYDDKDTYDNLQEGDRNISLSTSTLWDLFSLIARHSALQMQRERVPMIG